MDTEAKIVVEQLVNLFFQEAREGRKPGSHYTQKTWDMMRDNIYIATGKLYTVKYLKGHRDTIRKRWRSWCKLVDDATMKWDPITRTFGATDDDWKIHLKNNTLAGEYRKKVLLIAFEEKLAFIYKGDIELGTPYVSRRHMTVQVPSQPPPPQVLEPTPLPTLNLNEPAVMENEDNVEPADAPICTPLVAESLSSHIVVSPVEYEYTIGECIELLDGLGGIERGTDLYLFALDLFMTAERRETFVQLEEPSAKMTWLLNARQANGPIVVAP